MHTRTEGHRILIRFDPSDQDLLRARATRNFSLYRLASATELPNGQSISSWSFWIPAALRQNAKNKTPAPWAIRSPGRFFTARPRGQMDHWRPDGWLANAAKVRGWSLAGPTNRRPKSTLGVSAGSSDGLAGPRHRARAQSRVSPCAPTNKKPRIAPGLSEARCLLQGGVRAAFSQVSA